MLKELKYAIVHTNCQSEWLIYTMVWTTFLLAPFLAFYIRSQAENEMSFDWWPVFHVWMLFDVYFLLFLIHNFVLAPMLIYRKKLRLYVLAVLMLIGCRKMGEATASTPQQNLSHRSIPLSTPPKATSSVWP